MQIAAAQQVAQNLAANMVQGLQVSDNLCGLGSVDVVFRRVLCLVPRLSVLQQRRQ